MTDPLVLASRAAIARGSKSFALASKLFDPATRDRATLLYAWCRHCDDVVDGQADGMGVVASDLPPDQRLAALEAGTVAALAGEQTGVLAFDALARVAAEVGMPPRYPLDLIEGFRIDVERRPFLTMGDTLRYSYHVAGVVGVMMALCMGVAPGDRATLERACDLGLAFQLANIARDVAEDEANGRSYLPADLMRTLGRDGATAYLCDQAQLYEDAAVHGTPALPWRSAWAVLAAAGIYGGIGRKVARDPARAYGRRVSTTTAEKLAAVAAAYPAALRRGARWPDPQPSRDALWTMS